MPVERLQRSLARAGFGSRRACEELIPVGRLDRDTEGLLILTNDGALAHRLTHPRYAIEKEYLAEVDRPPSNRQLSRLRRGVELDDGIARAVDARSAGGARGRGGAGGRGG